MEKRKHTKKQKKVVFFETTLLQKAARDLIDLQKRERNGKKGGETLRGEK
jgi:hypothetical protein